MQAIVKFLFVLLLPLSVVYARTQPFDTWLQELRMEARQKGISDTTLDAALTGVKPVPRIIELDRSQPEFTQTFSKYMRQHVTWGRIAKGRALLKQYAGLLHRVQDRFGVQPKYLVSFWALESNFGTVTGGFHVIDALVTLAYEPRRSDFFRKELLIALRIIDEGNISVDNMRGSWAGAMGQLQFLPSVFEQYGIDGDHDGRIDIWNSLPDIFASAANFLSQSGWKGDERWGREVRLPDNFNYSQSGISIKRSVNDWSRLGIVKTDGSALPVSEMKGSIILPAGAHGPAFLVYDNFRTAMVWNRSIFYALCVGHLADRITGGDAITHMPVNERALSRKEISEMQRLLNKLGFDAGPADGIAGLQTRNAIRSFQKQQHMTADGYASHDILSALRK